MLALVAAVLAVAAIPAVLWIVDRLTQSPLMQQRVNAGTDRYRAERERAAAFGGSPFDVGTADAPGFEPGDWGGGGDSGSCDAGGGGGDGGSCD